MGLIRQQWAKLCGSRYLATLASGYAQVALQILVTLAQVPLVLGYLGKEGFGVWALAAQATIWLQMVDAGMNGALARHLIDYRGDLASSELRKCLATGFRVLSSQGLLVFALAAAIGSLGERAFGLDTADAKAFWTLMLLLGGGAAIGFSGKVVQSWLYASQRLDLANVVGLILLPTEFGVMWLLLHAGSGVYSLAWARLLTVLLAFVITWWFAVRHAGFPWRLMFSEWDRGMFRKLALFGGGMFLLTVGAQLLTVTQTAMTARYLGIAAAAVWATAPKIFFVAQQMVFKLWDYRIPHLSALMVAGRISTLAGEFRLIFRLTAFAGGGALGVLVAINPAFLVLWTRGQIGWEPVNDLLLAGAVYASLVFRCVTDFVLHTKKVGWMPVLMCLEGVFFVLSSSWLLPLYGISGMLFASLVFGGLLRVPYAWMVFRNYLGDCAPRAAELMATIGGGLALGVGIYALLEGLHAGLRTFDSRIVLGLQFAVAGTILCPLMLRLLRSLRKPQTASS